MNHIKTVKLKETKGTETISGSKMFSYIDSDFNSFEMDKKAKSTKAINVDVMETDKKGTLKDYFTNPERQVMTQGQILEFIKEHKDYLRKDGYATFFLFKVGDKFFVADVRLRDDRGLEVYVLEFSFGYVWDGEYRHRLMAPQLTLSESSPESLRPSETLTPSRSKYWNTMVNILEAQFPKGECAERGRALVMLAYTEMALTGIEFDENGEPIIKRQ